MKVLALLSFLFLMSSSFPIDTMGYDFLFLSDMESGGKIWAAQISKNEDEQLKCMFPEVYEIMHVPNPKRIVFNKVVNKLFVLSDNKNVLSASFTLTLKKVEDDQKGKIAEFKLHVVDIETVYSSDKITDLSVDKYGNVYISDYSKSEILMIPLNKNQTVSLYSA